MKKLRFKNTDKNAAVIPAKDLVKWQFQRFGKKIDKSRLPISNNIEVDFLQKNQSIPTITWIGHSTFLIQLNGLNILTDPVWTKHLGISKRLAPPGLKIKELPSIDLVFISHSHYDHLQYGALKKLKGDPTFFVPEGLAHDFIKKGFKKTIEFSWWQEDYIHDLKISFVPSQHWTRRTPFDTNTSHWGGWIIETQDISLYFVGDSGYFDGFKDIGSKYDIDYCFMPIGSYDPEWVFATQHINPERAVEAFIETGSTQFIPMHYGTYQLADDTVGKAIDRLNSEWNKRKLELDDLHILNIGETIRI